MTDDNQIRQRQYDLFQNSLILFVYLHRQPGTVCDFPASIILSMYLLQIFNIAELPNSILDNIRVNIGTYF